MNVAACKSVEFARTLRTMVVPMLGALFSKDEKAFKPLDVRKRKVTVRETPYAFSFFQYVIQHDT